MLEIFCGCGGLALAFVGEGTLSKIAMALAFVGLVLMVSSAAYGFTYDPALNMTANATPTIGCSWINNSTTSILICHR